MGHTEKTNAHNLRLHRLEPASARMSRPSTHEPATLQFVRGFLAALSRGAQPSSHTPASLHWHAYGAGFDNRLCGRRQVVAIPAGPGAGIRVRVGGAFLDREKPAGDIHASALVVHR